MLVRVLLLALALAVPAYANAQTAPAPNDGVSRIMRELERVLIDRRYARLCGPRSRRARTPAKSSSMNGCSRA